MVGYAQVLRRLPQEWPMTMLERAEAMEQQLREQPAVRREDFIALSATVQELADAQARTEQTLQALIAAQQAFEKRLQRLETRVGRIEGRLLEIVYWERATGYFGRVLRRPRVVDLLAILDTLEARLSRDEREELLNLDLLVTGRPRPPQGMPDQPDIWLAVGISAIPAVAGQELTIVARTLAQEEAVLILQDGGVLLWEEAFARFSGARRGNSPPSDL